MSHGLMLAHASNIFRLEEEDSCSFGSASQIKSQSRSIRAGSSFCRCIPKSSLTLRRIPGKRDGLKLSFPSPENATWQSDATISNCSNRPTKCGSSTGSGHLTSGISRKDVYDQLLYIELESSGTPPLDTHGGGPHPGQEIRTRSYRRGVP